jgi:hypothetical protein
MVWADYTPQGKHDLHAAIWHKIARDKNKQVRYTNVIF